MTTRFDLFERFLSYLVHPVSNFISGLVHHPVDTVVDAAVGAGEFVQEHPLTCIAIVGLGAYAIHRGHLKVNSRCIGVDVHVDTSLGGFHINNAIWRGNRSKYR